MSPATHPRATARKSPTIVWREPRAVVEDRRRQKIAGAFRPFVRLSVVALAAVVVATCVWHRCLPGEPISARPALGILAFGVIAGGLWISDLWTSMRLLSPRGLSVGLSVEWRKIEGFRLITHPRVPDARAVLLFRRLDTGVTFALPDDERVAQQIVQALEERVPLFDLLDESHAPAPGVGPAGAAVLTGVTLAYVAVMMRALPWAAHHLPEDWSKVWGQCLLCVFIFAGPGTIGCTLLYGPMAWRAGRIARTAALFNLLSIPLLIIAAFAWLTVRTMRLHP